MKKRLIGVLVILAVLSTILLVGCSESGSESKTEKETIGIIGAMDDEVASLKKAADIQKTTKIAEMEFCEGTPGGKDVVIVNEYYSLVDPEQPFDYFNTCLTGISEETVVGAPTFP